MDSPVHFLPLAALILSTKFGYGRPAALAIALALDFFAADIFFGLPSPFGRGLFQTSPPSLYSVKSVLSRRALVFGVPILEGAIAPIPREGIMLLSFHECNSHQHG